MGPGPVQPVPRGRSPAFGRPDARPPRSRVPRPARRDRATGCARCSAPTNPLTLPDQRHRLGRHGGGVRQRRRARRRRSSSASTACSASACATSPRAAAPRSCASRSTWGQPIDPERAARRPPVARRSSPWCTPRRRPACATTSTPLGAGKGDALLLVDCVTSLGGIPVEIDGWGVDLAYSGTQKCLGVPPGLSPLTVARPGPSSASSSAPQSWYLDLNMIGSYVGAATGARAYHHTAPISMIFALHAGLGARARRGPRRRRGPATPSAARLLQDGLEALGFELFAAEGHRLPELTTVWVPDGRRRGRGPCADAARALRHRDRRRPRRRTPARSGASAAWATPPGPATSTLLLAALASRPRAARRRA